MLDRVRSPFPILAFAVAAASVLGASCGSDRSDAVATKTGSAVSGDITVFAAASLTAAFSEIGEAFMVANPGVTVTFNFAASSELVAQIGEGAPADVFASADISNMTKLSDAGNTRTDPVVFATNIAQIIVGPGNPKGITGIADLADRGLIVIQCAPEVPCGKYAAQIYENAGVTVTPRSLEENVKAVVSKVILGEADAGIVYATDVIAAGTDAVGVDIAADVNVVAEYPIVITKDSANTTGASAFIEFVLSDPGRRILTAYGFGLP
jgi:molybdate transport system substrate-binding protein